MASPPLELRRSYFSEVSVRANPAFKAEVAGEVSVDLGIGKKSDGPPSEWLVTLTISTDPSEGNAYIIRARVHGDFVVIQPRESDDATASMVGNQGASILYSASREYLLLLTSRGPWGGFQLPTMSFVGEAKAVTDSAEVALARRVISVLAAHPGSTREAILEFLAETPGDDIDRVLDVLAKGGLIVTEAGQGYPAYRVDFAHLLSQEEGARSSPHGEVQASQGD